VTVSPEQAGQRLDRFLSTLEFIPSRSRAAELITLGLVTIDAKKLKASFTVLAGHRLHIELPEPTPQTLQPLNAPLDLLFEDEDLLVLSKPSGLVVHPAAGHAQDTLVNILLHHVGKMAMGFAENRPGIVHRLDRDTSGILVVAKNDMAHHALALQFRMKTAHRIYWAITQGRPKAEAGTIRTTLARHPHDRKRFASSPTGKGKLAITHYKVLQTLNSDISWIQCKLETGRTHQIRVHLSESGWPILGDPIYGVSKSKNSKAKVPRLALHACELGFEHPRSHEMMFFRVGWPEDLISSVKALGFQPSGRHV